MTGEVTYGQLHVGNVDRYYRIYRPSWRAQPVQLVIVLHGATGSAREIADTSRFDLQGERLGWVVAYPEAHNPSVSGGWAAYGCSPQPGIDDIGFIIALIEELIITDGVDRERVCVTGWSRGGMMAYRLACELASQVLAIAPVSGNMADERGSVDVGRPPARAVAAVGVRGSLPARL
jgi:polyhydroxybutyrate depolymerase